MSKSLESQVWQSALDAELKPVAAVMADMGNQDGHGIYPSVEYIAWLLSCSERSVQRSLAKLVKLSVLDRVANAKGGRGLTPRYRFNADRLPERPKWRDTQKGDKLSSFSRSTERVTPTTQKGDNLSEKGDNLSPDPLVDPLVIQETPLSPKRSHKPPEPEIVLDPPYHGQSFMEALGKFEKVKLEIKSPLTPTSREALYCKLAKFDEEIATIALQEAAAGGYKAVFPEKVHSNGNGNGYREAKPVQRVQTIRERMGLDQ